MIHHDEINDRQFRTVRIKAGYDPVEVDNFLDDVHKSYREMETVLTKVEVQAEHWRKTAENNAKPLEGIQDVGRILAVAQRTADEQVAEANGVAGDIIAKASREAERLIAEGHERRHAAIGELEVKRNDLEKRIRELSEIRSEMVDKVRSALSNLGSSE